MSHTVPALAAPSGIVPNFSNPATLDTENAIAQAFCLGVPGILFFLRCYVRLGYNSSPRQRQWVMEDWIVTASFAGLLVFGILLTAELVGSKGGVHQWDLYQSDTHEISFWFYILTIIYGPIIFITKLAIIQLYLRVFIPHRRTRMWYAVHAYTVISFSFYLAITLVKIFQCHPISFTWNKVKGVHGKCIDFDALLQSSGAFNTLSDTFLLPIPISCVWNLKLPLRQKLNICFFFTLGAIGAPIFAAVGFAVRVQTASSRDQSYHQPRILLFATGEIATGVICACLPILPALFDRRSSPPETQAAAPDDDLPSRANSHGWRWLQRGDGLGDNEFEYGNGIAMPARVFAEGGGMGRLDSMAPGGRILRTIEITMSKESASSMDGSEDSLDRTGSVL